MSFIVAIVGAESTGKSVLAAALHDRLALQGEAVALVPEFLRTFCERAGRTPTQAEQAGIAAEQTRLIHAAATCHDIVIADTSALMTAVYSDFIFRDTALYAPALRDHGSVDLTLLTALDLPWQAEAGMRDGAHVRAPVDALLRAALQDAGMAYSVVSGQGPMRTAQAWRALQAARQTRPAGPSRWRHACARCGDGDCERHLFGAAPPRGG